MNYKPPGSEQKTIKWVVHAPDSKLQTLRHIERKGAISYSLQFSGMYVQYLIHYKCALLYDHNGTVI